MTTSVFPITYGPNWGIGKSVQTKALRTDFGDGYGQRTVDGINAVRETWPLVWDNLTWAEADAADLFLRNAMNGGFLAFYWLPPGASSYKKWTCEQWTVTPMDGAAKSLSAAFVEVFDL